MSRAAAVRPMSAPVRLVPLRIQWPEPPVRTVQHVAQKGRERHREPRGGKGRRKKEKDRLRRACAKREDPERQRERERDAIRRGLDGEAVPAVARGRESGWRMRRWCGVERDGD